jgi:hypothetical protein
VNDFVARMETIGTDFRQRLQSSPRFAAILDGTVSESEYVDWFLVDSYYDVLRTPKYCATGARILADAAGPPRTEVIDILLAKAAEEQTVDGQGHEIWAMRDIASVRGWEQDKTVAWLTTQNPSPGSHAYNDFFRYLTVADPIGILGLAFAREFLADSLFTEAGKRLRESRLISNIENATMFIGGHGEADADHVRELYPVLESIRDERGQQIVIAAARVSAEVYLAKAVTPKK